MKTTNSQLAQLIKTALVEMTANDSLPSDMTTLDTTFIEDILKIRDNEDIENEPYFRAEHYLSYDDDMTTKEMVDAISDQAEIDGSVMIDDVDGVLVWEAVEYRFSCDDFLSAIGL